MLLRRSLLLFFLLAGLCSPKDTQAQTVLETDSLALLCIYLDFSGDDWTNNLNWLSDNPVDTWFGVVVSGNRVTSVSLPNNNLRGSGTEDINNLTALQTLDLADNTVESLPDLTSLFSLQTMRLQNNNLERIPQTATSALLELNVAGNRLEFDDLEPLVGLPINNFTYAPQQAVGAGGFMYVTPSTLAVLDGEVGGSFNEYQWEKDGTIISGFSPSPTLDIPNASTADEGTYTCTIINPNVPGLVLECLPVELLLNSFDLLGGEYIPNHLIMEFTDDATQQERDDLLDFYQATRLEICLCGVLELWLLPDTSFLPEDEILVGIEGVKEDAMTKSEIEEVGFNYVLALLDGQTPPTTYRQLSSSAPPLAPPLAPVVNDDLAVAVIDVGVDLTHPDMLPFVWGNDEEPTNGLDDDGNCIVDDRRGYNFIKPGELPLDEVNGHGTHVAGIVINEVAVTSGITVMALKSHEDNGFGTLFNALCGIYYARDQEARVINLSWGYTGELSPLLESAIYRAGLDCGALVVTSAGNDASDNDAFPHYPSSLELDNLISVAALNIMQDSLADFSNYGATSVDLAAPGERVSSLLPGNASGFKSGTSMAAAFVSNTAIQLYEINPMVTYVNVKSAILETVEELNSLTGLVETGGKLNPELAMVAIMDADPDTSCSIVLDLFAEPELLLPDLLVYPQPFYDWTKIEFGLVQGAEVHFLITDAMGRVVYQHRDSFPAGLQSWSWDGRSHGGVDLPSGMYFLRLEVGGRGVVGKMVKG